MYFISDAIDFLLWESKFRIKHDVGIDCALHDTDFKQFMNIN